MSKLDLDELEKSAVFFSEPSKYYSDVLRSTTTRDYDTGEVIDFAKNVAALIERVRKLERVATEYKQFIETMSGINRHMGYQFTQPIMEANRRLSNLENQ